MSATATTHLATEGTGPARDLPVPGRVVVLNDLTEMKGGATGLALLSARELRARGVRVTYVGGDRGDAGDALGEGIDVVAVGELAITDGSRLSAGFRGVWNRRAGRAVRDFVAANDTPDTVYHLHGWSKRLSPAVIAALGPVRRRLVIHAHDFFLACPNGAFAVYPRSRVCELRPLSARCVLTHCDKRSYAQKLWRVTRQVAVRAALDRSAGGPRILAIHEAMVPYLVRSDLTPERIGVLANPSVPFSGERIAVEKNDTVFYIGRLEPEKGVLDALAAARLAGTRLHVVGDGPLRATIEAGDHDAVLHGWRSREEIAALVASARVVVMPSRYPEPFGLVAVEALGSGVPVIFSETAFLARKAVAAGIGFACDTTDPGTFAATIRHVVDLPPAEAAALGRRAREHWQDLALTTDRWVDGLLAEYGRLLDASRRT